MKLKGDNTVSTLNLRQNSYKSKRGSKREKNSALSYFGKHIKIPAPVFTEQKETSNSLNSTEANDDILSQDQEAFGNCTSTTIAYVDKSRFSPKTIRRSINLPVSSDYTEIFDRS